LITCLYKFPIISPNDLRVLVATCLGSNKQSNRSSRFPFGRQLILFVDESILSRGVRVRIASFVYGVMSFIQYTSI
jgi:hypothetical protein